VSTFLTSGSFDPNSEWFGMHGYATPPPDAIVRYADGSFGPLMFHYLSEGCKTKDVAAENGFDIQWVEMEDVLPEDDPLYIDYFEKGASDVVRRWVPPTIDGWRLVGLFDTEDGPTAIYIKPRASSKSGGAE
jgi:hypothetical protein